jgi:hypothetical protein
MILDATAPSGEVDFAPIKSAAMTFGLASGGCALATTIARLLYPTPKPMTLVPVADPAPASLRRGFAALREDVFAGARFKVEIGEL